MRSFSNKREIVKINPYVANYFKDGVLVNRLNNMYTTKAIAEGFSNVNNLQQFMRGETGGAMGKTFSWAWRNLLLTPGVPLLPAASHLTYRCEVSVLLNFAVLICLCFVMRLPEITTSPPKTEVPAEVDPREPTEPETKKLVSVEFLTLGLVPDPPDIIKT